MTIWLLITDIGAIPIKTDEATVRCIEQPDALVDGFAALRGGGW